MEKLHVSVAGCRPPVYHKAGLCPCSAETWAYGERQRLPESGPGSSPSSLVALPPPGVLSYLWSQRVHISAELPGSRARYH